MLNLEQIKELINLVDQSSLSEVELEQEDFKLTIRKSGKLEQVVVQSAPAVQPIPAASAVRPEPAAAPAAAAAPEAKVAENLHTIVSPMVGTFYAAPSPTSEPYVRKGDKVSAKSVVCIVEAMKLMNEIEAEVAGEIVDILVENGQLVEFGQPLFTVRPE